MIDPTKTCWNLAQPLRSKDTFDNHKQFGMISGPPSPRISRPLASSLRVVEAMSSCNVLWTLRTARTALLPTLLFFWFSWGGLSSALFPQKLKKLAIGGSQFCLFEGCHASTMMH